MEVILEEVRTVTAAELHAYLCGAMRDGTRSRLHNTMRISQSSEDWRFVLKSVLTGLDAASWIYREGSRDMHVIESTYVAERFPSMETQGEVLAFLRGYFDAEGGIPKNPRARLYVQMCQKDLEDLTIVRNLVSGLGIDCGVLHNPSREVDPHYWRFFVRAHSLFDFFESVSSWHPRKRSLIQQRLELRARELKAST